MVRIADERLLLMGTACTPLLQISSLLSVPFLKKRWAVILRGADTRPPIRNTLVKQLLTTCASTQTTLCLSCRPWLARTHPEPGTMA